MGTASAIVPTLPMPHTSSLDEPQELVQSTWGIQGFEAECTLGPILAAPSLVQLVCRLVQEGMCWKSQCVALGAHGSSCSGSEHKP